MEFVNINDNVPRFDNLESTINLLENVNNATAQKISATDADDLGNLRFTFVDEPKDSPFSLQTIDGNSDSVWLSVNGSLLDFEKQQFWSLKIMVEDEENLGGPYNTTFELYVKVEDQPDNGPSWQIIPPLVFITEEEDSIVSDHSTFRNFSFTHEFFSRIQQYSRSKLLILTWASARILATLYKASNMAKMKLKTSS